MAESPRLRPPGYIPELTRQATLATVHPWIRVQDRKFLHCPKSTVIDFPRHNMKCSGENETLSGIFHVVSRFPLHFVLYKGNLDYFLDSVGTINP